GTDEFPAFYLRSSGSKLAARVDTPAEAARFIEAHWDLGGAGIVLAQPIAADVALSEVEMKSALIRAEEAAREAKIAGPALTPFLLARLAELTQGRTLQANHN